ncbi:MAG: hypothetical protein ACXIUB_05605 [Wenzhouxiangella sp.]
MIAGWCPGSRFKEVCFPGRIKGGNWHESILPRELVLSNKDHKVNSVIAHFKDGVPWIETGLFRTRYAKQMNGDKLRLLAKDYEKYDRLFEDVKINGFRTPSFDSEISPMFIHIGPLGEIFWTAGANHRLAMALILGLPLPVFVLNRHVKWQKVREAALLDPASLPDSLLDHPDLEPRITTSETAHASARGGSRPH